MIEDDPQILVTELGGTELPGASPLNGWIADDPRTELRGQHGAKLYRRMADDDPVIGATLYALEMMLRHVEWSVVAADVSDEAQLSRDWVNEVLFRELELPFGDVIAEALSMMTYGYAPFEVVYQLREDGTLGVRKLAPRSQESVYRWIFDARGQVRGLEQLLVHTRPATSSTAVIPWYKLLNFRTVSRRNNPEGRSLLRNAYLTWLRKQRVEDAEGRAALRSAGLVVLRVPGRYLDPTASPEDRALGATYRHMADRLAQDQRGSVVLPGDRDASGHPVVDLDYLVADGRRSADMTPIVERFDRRMAATVLADFIFLGQQSVGSYALAEQKTNMFALGAGAILDALSDQFNTVLLPRLWALNGWDPATQPFLQPGDLDEVDLDRLGRYVSSLTSAGAQLFPNRRLEEALLNLANLPVEQDTERV